MRIKNRAGRILALALGLVAAVPAAAQERTRIGVARAFTNDALGDFHDRWRTGSYAVSVIRARNWSGRPGAGLGDTVEWRLRSEIIAPADLTNPVIGTDRRYAGILSIGPHAHMERDGTEYALGLDLVLTGPMTGMGDFQTAVHRALGAPVPAVLGSQIGNAARPTLLAEAARRYPVPGGDIRPFIEAQAGAETFLRIGADLTFGAANEAGLRVRDVVSGHRLLPVGRPAPAGTSLLLGADAAFVSASHYLPAASGYRLVSPRLRARAGVMNQTERFSVFYGVTWLGREFAAQPEGQAVGTVSLDFRF